MADILVPFDFSKNAMIALDQALLITSANKKKLEVLHITNDIAAKDYPRNWKYDGQSISIIENKLNELVEERKSKLELEAGLKTSILVKEAATISGGVISRMLQSGSKLLVMGTHGSTGIYDKVFGSNTAVLVNHSLFPILVIPHTWKAVPIQQCMVLFKLQKLSAVAGSVKSWGKFFNSSVEAVHFTISREAEGEYANKTAISNIPCRLIVNPVETPLAEDILVFSKKLKNTILLLLTREKTFLEKLFQPNLTYNLSGKISIPLLTVPLEGIKKH